MLISLKRLNDKRGFTLIELMVVIGIIGILAGIAVPKVTSVKERANISVVKSDLRNIQTALEIYAMQNSDQYPDEDNFSSIEFDDPSDYSYEVNNDKDGYLVYYSKPIEAEYYYIMSTENGIKNNTSEPSL